MVFKRIQNILKKEKVPMEGVTLMTLEKGSIFDYDLDSWEVLAAYEYDWGNHNFSREYRVSNGKDKYYMNVEDEEDLLVSFNKKMKIGELEIDFRSDIEKGGKPPKTLVFNDKTYLYDKESPGYYREIKKGVSRKESDWEELLSWTYLDKEESTCITIEQWGEDEFESYYGFFVKENKISNLLPTP